MGEATPFISIGMMAHNSARHIGEAIESVLAQDRGDWELLISDDASTDGTGDVVHPYLADPRVSYVYQKDNLGQARNWWHLIVRARAPVFARLDADDRWLPGTAAWMLETVASGADVAIGGWKRVYESGAQLVPEPRQHDGRMTGLEAYQRQCHVNTVLQGAMASRTSLALHCGSPLPQLRYMVDFEYILRLMAASATVASTEQVLLLYRVHASNETSAAQRSLGYVLERPLLWEACQRHVTINPRVAGVLPQLRAALARNDFSDGLSEAVRRDRERGYSIMRDAALRCPEIARHPKVRADLWLSGLGLPGYLMLRLLHSRRVRA